MVKFLQNMWTKILQLTSNKINLNNIIMINNTLQLQQLLQESLELNRKIFIDCIIKNQNGEVFSQKRSANRNKFPNCWDLPGGGLEDVETIEECVRRELMEELNFELENIVAVLYVMDYDLPEAMRNEEENYKQRVIQVVITVKDYSNPILEEGKADEYRWFNHENLDVLMGGRDGNTEEDRYTLIAVQKGLEFVEK
jgi:mutator protein MutT